MGNEQFMYSNEMQQPLEYSFVNYLASQSCPNLQMYEHPVNTKSMTKTPMAVAHSPQAQLPTSNSEPAVAHSPRAPDNSPETQEARSLAADEYLSNVSCSNFGSIVDNQNSELDYVSFNVNQINNTAKVITLFVNGRNVEFQVDTGADITCMSCRGGGATLF